MKGQIFLLTTTILVAVLLTLSAFSRVSHITSEREILDVSLEELIFRNIKTEVEQIIASSSSTPRNITDNAIDFLNMTRTGSVSHSQDFRTLFVGALANSTNQTMNVTVYHFLSETNLNVTIRLNTSTEQTNSTLLNDSGVWYNNFSFTRGEGYNLTLILPDRDYQENITFKTRETRAAYTGFFDLRLLSERAEHRSRFTQTVKIS